MNKEMIKKSTTLTEMYELMNFSDEDKKEIEAKVRLYTLVSSFRDEVKKKELTNQELAEKSGIPRPEVSKILNGKTNVSLKRLQLLAHALGKRIEIKLV
jgi:predicted XRE-type DNA-binding protein